MQTSVKQQAIDVIKRLPDDATIEQVMEQLSFLARVRRGLEDIDAARVVPHAEAKRRFGR